MIEPEDTTIELNCYPIGDKIYTQLAVDHSFVESTFRNNFQEVTVKQLPAADVMLANRGIHCVLFVTAWKK